MPAVWSVLVIDRTKVKARIEEWGTAPGGDGWQAPELSEIVLVGKPVEHDDPYWAEKLAKDPDWHIKTSSVVEVDGRFVKTRSGSVYELGEPHPDFVQEYGPIDRENPIKVRK